MIDTFNIFLSFMITVCALALLGAFWMAICNYRTYNQRQTIIFGVN